MATTKQNSLNGSKRRREPLTAGDRLVCAGFGAVAGLTFWVMIYTVLFFVIAREQSKPTLVAKIAAGKAPASAWDVVPDFWYWATICASVLALYGAVVGPERMMDGIKVLFRKGDDWNTDFSMQMDMNSPD